MSTFEDGLKAYLASSPYPLPDVENRIYSHAAPQTGSTPYIVIYRISATPRMTHKGAPGMIERQMQFSIFGPSQSQILGIADALRRLINGYAGAMGDYTVRGVFWQGERPGYNELSKLHQISSDFTFQYVDEPEPAD